MATVTFDAATRVYPGTPVPAVDGLDLSVQDGEFLDRDVVDEPLSNLDAKLRVRTRTQIASLQRRLPVQVEVVEELGADAYTYGSLAQPGKESHQVIARVDGRRPPEKGSTVHFTPKTGHAHLFHTSTGLRVPA